LARLAKMGSGVPKAQPAYHGPPPPDEGTDEQPATEVTDQNRVKLKLTVCHHSIHALYY
jgi:hypothetical protein